MNTNDFSKLELSTETIRELTEGELTRVNGGVLYTGTTITPTEFKYCPSGYTWTANCNIDTRIC
jgi:hypothetical protein